jgi:hypothetical protein
MLRRLSSYADADMPRTNRQLDNYASFLPVTTMLKLVQSPLVLTGERHTPEHSIEALTASLTWRIRYPSDASGAQK